jgi:hypothetical protein
MDWHLSLLLLAIVVTYLAWRRAQRQSELQRVRAAALEEARWRYTLLEVPASAGLGPGYEVADAGHGPLDWRELRWDEHGIQVIDVSADPAAASVLLDEVFDAGAGVRLEAGTDDAGVAAVAVWDEGRSVRGPDVAGPLAAHLQKILEKGELADCIVLREAARGAADTRVRLLLVHRDTDVVAEPGA